MQNDQDQVSCADDLNHPRNEEWMAWLYNESSPAERTRLTAHLQQCGQCRAEIQRWERTREMLDVSKVEAPRVRARVPMPWLKWGIAAAITLTAGFAIGRSTSPSAAEIRALRFSLKAEVLAEMDQRLAEYKTTAEEKSAQDNKLILAALAKTDADRVADYASLHKDIETVAVLTQNSFQQTQQQIVTLANYTQPQDKTSNQ